jgi:hypothetical protein
MERESRFRGANRRQHDAWYLPDQFGRNPASNIVFRLKQAP